MRNASLSLALVALLAVQACKPSVQLPVRTGFIAVPVSVDQLVCHVRAIAAEQQLDFHFSTFENDQGPKATMRLVGQSF